MSIFDTFMKARAHSKAVRALNNLPPEIQKDIGWPVSPRSNARDDLTRVIWSAAR